MSQVAHHAVAQDVDSLMHRADPGSEAPIGTHDTAHATVDACASAGEICRR
jgi:hypothetical protein